MGQPLLTLLALLTVCGEKWLENYMEELSQEQVNQMLRTETPSCRPFQFGGGNVVNSTRKVKLPAKTGKTKCSVEAEVVSADIPLLLSKTSLKTEQFWTLENDSA